jgi:hypothetical protein
MIIAVNSDTAKQKRREGKGRSTGFPRWRTEFIGSRADKEVKDHPQAFLVELAPNATISPHFHQVDQYQIVVAGGGTLGRNTTALIALHYVDHHTAYGPIDAGPHGLSFFTLRAKSDTGSIRLNTPGYKDFLQPTKKRYLLAENLGLSTEPVLQNRAEIALENVFPDLTDDDGLGAHVLRMGANMTYTGPDPRLTGGQFYLVLNGSLRFDAADYPVWSTVYASPTDGPLRIATGDQGLEALILNFPRAPT